MSDPAAATIDRIAAEAIQHTKQRFAHDDAYREDVLEDQFRHQQGFTRCHLARYPALEEHCLLIIDVIKVLEHLRTRQATAMSGRGHKWLRLGREQHALLDAFETLASDKAIGPSTRALACSFRAAALQSGARGGSAARSPDCVYTVHQHAAPR